MVANESAQGLKKKDLSSMFTECKPCEIYRGMFEGYKETTFIQKFLYKSDKVGFGMTHLSR